MKQYEKIELIYETIEGWSARKKRSGVAGWSCLQGRGSKRMFFIHNPVVQINFIVMMIRWTGLAP